MRYFLFALGLLVYLNAGAQDPTILKNIEPDAEYDNVHVKPISTDERASSFVIWVKKEVKAHYHAEHSEQIYVISGKGRMTLGEKSFEIKKGMWLFIPKGAVHSVVVTSKKPLKVLSVQAPEFKGKDRIFVEP